MRLQLAACSLAAVHQCVQHTSLFQVGFHQQVSIGQVNCFYRQCLMQLPWGMPKTYQQAQARNFAALAFLHALQTLQSVRA